MFDDRSAIYSNKYIDVKPTRPSLKWLRAPAASIKLPRMGTPSMARLTLRLDFGPGRAIGHGKIRLLEAVRDYGSISAAGRSMGMSYRRAWLLIDELNHMFEEPVIGAKHGGSGGGGAALTPFGHAVVQRYRSIEAKAHAATAGDLDVLAAAAIKSTPKR